MHFDADPHTGGITEYLDEPMNWPTPTGLTGLSEDQVTGWYLLFAADANADEQARVAAAGAQLRRAGGVEES